MHCSSSADALPPPVIGRAALSAAFTGLLLFAAAALADDSGFIIEEAQTSLVDGVHRLNARIALRFSPEAIEAMENGVGMTVAVQSEVLAIKPVLDRTVARVDARYRIQVHALSRQFTLRNLSTGEASSYRDLEEMSRALGDIQDFPLLDDHVLDADQRYRVRVRAVLEIESLPTPLRLAAYFKSAWRLSSDWLSWPLQR